MLKRGRSTLLSIGLLLVLALGAASCSTQAPGTAVPTSDSASGRSIKVYESPT